MIEDDLTAADLPGAWREKYQQCLGVASATDADGCLQDVHWSAGLFGYFPTYTLGNLYAGQFFARANEELGDQQPAFRHGEFEPLLKWLRDKIHRQGRRYSASELGVQVTGQPLTHGLWMDQIRRKYGELYGI
jgi:carboxypeptidase Taq